MTPNQQCDFTQIAVGVAETTGDSNGLTVMVKPLLVAVAVVTLLKLLVMTHVMTSPVAKVVVV